MLPREEQVLPFKRMVRGPFAALLRVPDSGFRWAPETYPIPGEELARDSIGPWLVVHSAAVNGTYDARQYAPMAVPDLHRRFSRLKPSEDRILAFANRYGMLAHGQSRLLSPRGGPMFSVEDINVWRTEQLRVRMLVQLWELVQAGDARELQRYFRWQRTPLSVGVRLAFGANGLLPDMVGGISGAPPPVEWRNQTLADELRGAESAELLSRWEYGDPIEPARYYVHREVNNGMKGHVHPAVLPFLRGEIFFFPDCLLGAIYTHFALALSGRVRPAILCARPGCGSYFTPKRTNQKYCDDACKQLAWVNRNRGEFSRAQQ